MEAREVKIYANEPSSRLKYIADLLLGDILGLHYEIVADRRKIGKHPAINYSNENIQGTFHIEPSGLLSEKDVTEKKIIISEWKSLPVFFLSQSEADIPFDIFSASFYLVSRYEEYLPSDKDIHGRFKASNSVAFQNGFLRRPVVDLWLKEFVKLLIRKFPFIAVKRNEYKALLTMDVDQPFAYLGKNLFRKMGGLIKDIADKNRHVEERYKVMTHEKKDPFDVYDYIFEQIKNTGTTTRFFLSVGDLSKNDHNPSWKNEKYRTLINSISSDFIAGLHPSYESAEKLNLIDEELKRLKTITGKQILTSRFHFIRFTLPVSYRKLVKLGFTEDYSMGYPEQPGFRAGISRPFKFFDLLNDNETSLKIVPFFVMDATLYSYLKLSANESEHIINELITETRNVGGQFVSLWHNTSLLENDEWASWRHLFETMLKQQQ